MTSDKYSLLNIRKIDNSRHWLPLATTFLLIFLIILFIWFFKGGSFKLYASVFFTLYNITGQIWVCVLLMGILQNIVFLPLRLIGRSMDQPLKDFEDELDKLNQSEQFMVFSKSIKEGSLPIVYYIFNFFVNAIAFFSAGRIFLIDFYSQKLNPHYLYSFVKYPEYPLQGTHFRFPFFNITETTAVSWSNIFLYLGSSVLFLIVIRLIWRLFKIILWKNKQILKMRIQYNRLLFKISGFSTVLLIALIIFLRHIPTDFITFIVSIDLTRQNTPMNFFTAVGTFITVFHANYKNAQVAAEKAKSANVPENIIKKVLREKIRQGAQNAFFLGLGAFLITNNIPSAFELSVATFEVMYMIYPYTFGQVLNRTGPQIKKTEPSL